MIYINYPFLIWILTIFCGPLSFLIYIYFDGDSQDFSRHMSLMLPAILIGFVFSLPTFLFLLLGFHWLIKFSTKTYLLKTLSIIIGVAGIIISFQILEGYLTSKLTVFYSVAWTIFGLIIPIKLEKEELNNQEQENLLKD